MISYPVKITMTISSMMLFTMMIRTLMLFTMTIFTMMLFTMILFTKDACAIRHSNNDYSPLCSWALIFKTSWNPSVFDVTLCTLDDMSTLRMLLVTPLFVLFTVEGGEGTIWKVHISSNVSLHIDRQIISRDIIR